MCFMASGGAFQGIVAPWHRNMLPFLRCVTQFGVTSARAVPHGSDLSWLWHEDEGL
jgi:hypothetical protein